MSSVNIIIWVAKGSVQIIINEIPKKNLRVGDGFGELALLYNASRSGSAKAMESCCFWGIDRAVFRKAVEELAYQEHAENRKFIGEIAFFSKNNDGLILNEYRWNDIRTKRCYCRSIDH